MTSKWIKIWTGILLFFLLFNLFLRIEIISFHHLNVGGVELNVMYGVQRVVAEKTLYTDPTDIPYAVVQYPPFYYYLLGNAAKLCNIDAYEGQGIFVISRIFSLFFNLLLSFLSFWIARRYFKTNFFWAFLSAVLCFISIASHYYSRADSLHIVLFLLSIYSFLVYLKKDKNNLYLILSAIFTVASIFAKQSGILLGGIIGIYLLFFLRNFKAILWYGIACALSGVFFLWLTVGFASEDLFVFYQNVYLGLKNGASLTFLKDMFTSQFYLDIMPWYFLGCILAVYFLAKKQEDDKRFLAWAVLLSFIFAIVTGFKIGSSVNYFTEFLVLAFIAFAIFFQDKKGSLYQSKFFKGFFVVGVSVTILFKTLGLFSIIHIDKYLKDDIKTYQTEKKIADYFINDLKIKKDEYIFSQHRSYIDHFMLDNAVAPIKDVIEQIYHGSKETFPYQKIFEDFDKGEIKYLLTTYENPQLQFLDVTFQHFKFLKKIDKYAIYVYQKP